MFTGIIEHLGKVKTIHRSGQNVEFEIEALFQESIQVDQSISHNGVCLTVTAISQMEVGRVSYSVTAIEETLLKTNLGQWKVGDEVNLERCLKVGDRLDGHFVQGHVDTTATLQKLEDRDGSWNLYFETAIEFDSLMVDKGSICVNGISLTIVSAWNGGFSVSIIPYTWEHTNLKSLQTGEKVNVEFDILGKYLLKLAEKRLKTVP